ncbi:MAG TPA: DUF4388 domain-containing protein [Sulfurihydrogenibium sp.]|jgi:hypothetical protein|uniref:DUF4388 domain-containing protein n=1 Tax=Sulfurihydrogenibium sp. (strain YO3AOP1) TaxID=436114 RepID=UPI0001724E0C|nr:DUF4388 domain-containing protein [Sulfurihydrogenibium sp. YO3AOP1]ACD65727.1 putative protein [Sulfurihydrogenibium sp. YO3AOP1]HBT97965.1 DUF4388 domain-containing protein [Sulfurihydrogenibium sp.]
MAIAGDLKIFNFVDIFQILLKDKKDGILVIEQDHNNIAVYFKEGDIVYIREVKKVFYIYLDVDFETVLKKEDIPKSELYNVLVARLPKLLSIKEGKFSFTSGFIKYPTDLKSLIPIEKLIMYLARQLTEEEVERKISDLNLVFEKSPNYENIARKAFLTDYEKKILHLIDGKNKVVDIIYNTKINDLTVKRTLYGFLACGIIQREKKKERKIGFDLTKNLLNKIISKIKGL